MLWVNLKEFDNDKLAEIILSKGDVQNKKTNVKANMTDWRLDTEHKEVSNLANKVIELASDMRKSYSDIKILYKVLLGCCFILKVITQMSCTLSLSLQLVLLC